MLSGYLKIPFTLKASIILLHTLGVVSGVPLGGELSLFPRSNGKLFDVDSPNRSRNEDKSRLGPLY